MLTKDIAYQHAGKTLTGYLANDDSRGGRRPGVLLCHQGGGLTEHTKERARMLAELGYVAFALDMYGAVATSREQSMTLMTALTQNPRALRVHAHAGLDLLKSRPEVDPARIAAIGYCFGGGVALELARSRTDLAAVVAFHPGLTDLPEADDRAIACKVAVCAGIEDPLIPAAARERLIELMIASGADWQLLVYGGAGHSFTDRSVDAFAMTGFFYNQAVDRRSWAAMISLFDETMGAP
jgi:dienelactone hydrolase